MVSFTIPTMRGSTQPCSTYPAPGRPQPAKASKLSQAAASRAAKSWQQAGSEDFVKANWVYYETLRRVYSITQLRPHPLTLVLFIIPVIKDYR